MNVNTTADRSRLTFFCRNWLCIVNIQTFWHTNVILYTVMMTCPFKQRRHFKTTLNDIMILCHLQDVGTWKILFHESAALLQYMLSVRSMYVYTYYMTCMYRYILYYLKQYFEQHLYRNTPLLSPNYWKSYKIFEI
jgi:hypothetical protein